MNKLLLLALTFLSGFSLLSQTGPAGVGSSVNNVFWLKANAGTSSTTNNTAISSWNDQSGNAINMTQTVAAQQPSFATNVINGLPAVQFDNVSGSNDKLVGPDSPLLDNTNGYSFFTVSRLTNVGDARSVISKRTNVGVDQSFMLFYYNSNKFNVDIQTNDNRFASNFSYATNTNYIIDIFYDGTLPQASRVNLYLGETLDKTSDEANSTVPNNASPILMGSTDLNDGRPFGGYICEVIIYREALIPAGRIIINNYLSAKYNIALAANDKYAGDNSGNGDYDFDVAGIGRETTGSNTSFAASIAGGFGVSSVSGLDDTDYLLAGHATAVNSAITTDVAGLSGVNKARWQRTWYVDVTNTSADISANVEFDLSDGGLAGSPGTAGDYRLLYRAGQSGAWTEMATASSISGDRILFSSVTFTADGYYTLGSVNFFSSPLPIELTEFTAIAGKDKVDLAWATATEKNNAYFTIEKSRDGERFEPLMRVKGAGNSSSRRTYHEMDSEPFNGLSYYRLKQTDADERSSFSPLVAVDFGPGTGSFASVYPNPSDGIIHIDTKDTGDQDLTVNIWDTSGKLCYNKTWLAGKYASALVLDTENKLAKGNYVISVSAGGRAYSQKIIIR